MNGTRSVRLQWMMHVNVDGPEVESYGGVIGYLSGECPVYLRCPENRPNAVKGIVSLHRLGQVAEGATNMSAVCPEQP